MRRGLALVAVVLAAGFGSTAAPSATLAPTAAARTCCAGYVLAHLSWGDKCLRAGEFCKVHNREYLKYGFYCPATRHLRHR